MPMIGGNNAPKINQRLLGNINNVYTRHWKCLQTTGKTNYTSTFNLITVAPCQEYLWVRPILKNSESVPVQIAGMLLAPTNNKTNRCVPSVGNTLTNDSTTGWTQATFSGSNTVTLPVGSSTQPSITLGDWMQIRSIASNDGAAYPYILARVKMVESGTFSGTYLGTGNTDNTLDTYARADSAVGDFVTNPAGMTANSGEVSAGPMGGFEFKTSSSTVKILAVGSSTTQGGGNPIPQDANYRSWVPITQELLRATHIPACVFNYGCSGNTTAQYAALGKAAIDAHQPSIVLYPPFTTNEGIPTQAIVDAQYATAIDFAEYALSRNCLPVFTFLCPNDAYDATADGFRKSLMERCETAGFVVCDMTTAVGDGAMPERFQSAYYYDGTHTNDAGYQRQAAICAETLTEVLNHNLSW